mmetsp:Transcript_19605/g.55278  ORF Transcript_19605/g.55278 Transcript_19605/m.55278 type:complete len:104 (-) Transcript_19605:117-428(-)
MGVPAAGGAACSSTSAGSVDGDGGAAASADAGPQLEPGSSSAGSAAPEAVAQASAHVEDLDPLGDGSAGAGDGADYVLVDELGVAAEPLVEAAGDAEGGWTLL